MKIQKLFLILIPFILFSCAENFSEKAKKFSQEKIIIDTHIDTPFQIWRQRITLVLMMILRKVLAIILIIQELSKVD